MGAYRLNEAKELAIYTWVYAATGVTTIWDKPGAKRPALPYVTMNILSGSPRKLGKADEIYKSADTFTYNFRKAITLSCNIYANNAYLEYMETLINSLELETYRAGLRIAGFALWGNSDPVDLTVLLDTKFEHRVSADFFFSYNKAVDAEIGEIRKVTFESDIGDFVNEETVDTEA